MQPIGPTHSRRLGRGTLTVGIGQVCYERDMGGYAAAGPMDHSQGWEVWSTCAAWSATISLPLGCAVIAFAMAVQTVVLVRWLFLEGGGGSTDGGESGHAGPLLVPLIPGWTIPLYHTPILLFSLILTVISHEMGHAIAAIRESIPIRSVGAFLVVLFPGAFVRLEEDALEGATRRARWVIASAGIWHNVILALVALLAVYAQLTDHLATSLGAYAWVKDGVMVVSVRSSSGLYTTLPYGSKIQHVDDAFITSEEDWVQRLGQGPLRRRGYCTPLPGTGDASCCDIDVDHPFGRSQNVSEGCFTPWMGKGLPFGNGTRSCLPLRMLLHSERCDTSDDCHFPTHSCITPYDPQPAGRITLLRHSPPPWGTATASSNATVYVGYRRDILRSVEVYHLSPSSSWLPVSLPRQWGLFMHYLLMLNVSFALFNALPLPALDGEALLAEFAMMGYLPEELIGWINSFSAWLPVMLVALFIGSLFQLLILPV